MSYQELIESEAKDFLSEQEEDIVQALADGAEWDRNNIAGLDRSWHESITDRSYNQEDAAFILRECNNEETDSGLWAEQDHDTMMATKAAYTFSNDVWEETKALYEELKEEYEDLLGERQEVFEQYEDAEEDAEEDEELEEVTEPVELEVAQEAFEQYMASEEIAPFEEGSKEESEIFREWLELGSQIGMRSGYPVGSCYIDSTLWSHVQHPDYEYTQLDQKVAKRIPRIGSKNKAEAIDIMVESNPLFADWHVRKELFDAISRVFFNSENLGEMVGKVAKLTAKVLEALQEEDDS